MTPALTTSWDGTDVVARCRELAAITDVPGETTRTFLSEGMRRANAKVGEWMRALGLATQTDAAGNLRGLRAASASNAKTLILASHLDTVPNAGAFDGVLGVIMALAVVHRLDGQPLPFNIQVIAFSEEEGVRFGVPFIGSRALAGTLDNALLSRTDANGTSVRDAMRADGLREADLPAARITRALGYLEFHIEQGPVLEEEGLPLGIVETIAGQSRIDIRFSGTANHAGTTPMHLRHDALAAAAAAIVETERYATATRGLVATVGSITAKPNAGNVIAGQATVSLDIRSALDTIRHDAVAHLQSFAETEANKRGLTVTHTTRMDQPAVPMDRTLLRLLEDAVDATGTLIRRMPSGAGHDAMIVAAAMPTAMLFLRSPGGLSHHPAESVAPADVELGVQAGVAFVHSLAAQENLALTGNETA